MFPYERGGKRKSYPKKQYFDDLLQKEAKTKRNVYKYCTLLSKFVNTGCEQTSKYITDYGSQVSHYQRKTLQIRKRG